VPKGYLSHRRPRFELVCRLYVFSIVSLASYDKAIALKASYAEVHFNRGNALFRLRCLEDAAKSYKRVVDIKSDYFDALALHVLCSSQICAWSVAEESKSNSSSNTNCRHSMGLRSLFW
jgi:tetratricopeptide (TPR) repeat protein